MICQAASFGGTNIDPTAWEDKKCKGESRFPAQVRIRVRKICKALEEDAFRPVLHHYDGPKFRLELSVPEAVEHGAYIGVLDPYGAPVSMKRKLAGDTWVYLSSPSLLGGERAVPTLPSGFAGSLPFGFCLGSLVGVFVSPSLGGVVPISFGDCYLRSVSLVRRRTQFVCHLGSLFEDRNFDLAISPQSGDVELRPVVLVAMGVPTLVVSPSSFACEQRRPSLFSGRLEDEKKVPTPILPHSENATAEGDATIDASTKADATSVYRGAHGDRDISFRVLSRRGLQTLPGRVVEERRVYRPLCRDSVAVYPAAATLPETLLFTMLGHYPFSHESIPNSAQPKAHRADEGAHSRSVPSPSSSNEAAELERLLLEMGPDQARELLSTFALRSSSKTGPTGPHYPAHSRSPHVVTPESGHPFVQSTSLQPAHYAQSGPDLDSRLRSHSQASPRYPQAISAQDFQSEFESMKRELSDLRRQLKPKPSFNDTLPDFCGLRIPPPSQLLVYRKFNGAGDPYIHLKDFLYESVSYQHDRRLLAYLFRRSLDGPALEWFYSLPLNEAEDFEIVKARFVQQYQDRAGPEYSMAYLVAEQMKPDEEFATYADRWRQISTHVQMHIPEEEKIKLIIANATPMLVDPSYSTGIFFGSVIYFAILFIDWVLIIHYFVDTKPVVYEHPILLKHLFEYQRFSRRKLLEAPGAWFVESRAALGFWAASLELCGARSCGRLALCAADAAMLGRLCKAAQAHAMCAGAARPGAMQAPLLVCGEGRSQVGWVRQRRCRWLLCDGGGWALARCMQEAGFDGGLLRWRSRPAEVAILVRAAEEAEGAWKPIKCLQRPQSGCVSVLGWMVEQWKIVRQFKRFRCES
ncbi:hypothetical protein Taro_035299 [Colocasia esculenta]|uniref:DCD domain-containing protein n=1 Tax=Colocasia esculenta TaxID=4460 RepID=A0A843WEH0_COLES|nr:hypothetical protein [Colocasia esculenta]